MDYSILVLLALIVLVIGVTFGAKYLKKKDVVGADDVTAAINILGITIAVADELKLRDDKKIKIISDVIVLTTRYVQQSLTKITKDQALEYAKSLCVQFGVELTTARIEILSELLDMALAKIQEKDPEPVVETKDSQTTEESVNEAPTEETTEVEKGNTPDIVEPVFEDTAPKAVVEDATVAIDTTKTDAVVPEFTEK